MGRQRRSTIYRVEPDDRDILEVTLSAPGIDPVPGVVVDVTVEGAGVRFPLSLAPSIAVGTEVTLEFGSRNEKILTIQAQIKFRREEDAYRRYGLDFTDKEMVEKQLPPALARLFNRRGAFRVKPRPGVQIDVTLEGFLNSGGVERTTIPMVDLSVTGLAVTVSHPFEDNFAGNVDVRVSFELPGYNDLINVGAVIHYRKLLKEGVHYGIGFDPRRTANFTRQRKAIMDYVVKRYREEQLKYEQKR